MQLTIFTDYALRSLMFVAAHPERLCNVKEIADYYAISRHHLVKVVHRLVQLGHLTSTKGKGGGIALAGDPKRLRLGDLIKQLEPNINLVECFDPETNTCKIVQTCALKHCLKEASQAFIHALNQHTLWDVLPTSAKEK